VPDPVDEPSRQETAMPRRARHVVAAACYAALALSPLAALAGEPAEPLDRLAFLTGCWRAVDGDAVIEEQWLPPAGGVLVGVARTVEGDELQLFEFLRIEARDGAWHYVAQPNGVLATWFKLTHLGDDEAVFEDPTHDFPQKIRYRKLGADELHAETSGPGRDGKEKTFSFHYRRASCPNEQAPKP
jgi:hypothetical protein